MPMKALICLSLQLELLIYVFVPPDTRVFFLRVRLDVSVSAADRSSAHEKFLTPGVSLSKGTNNLLGLETLQTGHQSRHRIIEEKISTSPQRQTVEWRRISQL